MEGKALAFLVCVYTRSLVSHKPVHSIGKLPERFNAPTITFSMSILNIQMFNVNIIINNISLSVPHNLCVTLPPKSIKTKMLTAFFTWYYISVWKCNCNNSIQYSSVTQSCPTPCEPMNHRRGSQASLSITNSRSSPKHI